METKAPAPFQQLDSQSLAAPILAYFEFCQLKQLYRQGWLRSGVSKEHCESVAEHSLGVGVLALWLAEAYFPNLDAQKVLRMALFHDFGEIYAGDFTPGDGISPEEKSRLEEESVSIVFGRLPQGESYLALWREFENGDTPEARFVRQVDRLEMAFQASLYQRQGYPGLEGFFASARKALVDGELLALLEQVQNTSPHQEEL